MRSIKKLQTDCIELTRLMSSTIQSYTMLVLKYYDSEWYIKQDFYNITALKTR